MNAVTVRDCHLPTHIDDVIDTLEETCIFLALDASSGYWQVGIDERDFKTAVFNIHHSLYQSKRMQFRLTNEYAFFQTAMNGILSSIKWQSSLFYLDNIVVLSKTVEQNFSHLCYVLTLLRDASKKFRLKKRSCFVNNIEYLGYVIRPGKLEREWIQLLMLSDGFKTH